MRTYPTLRQATAAFLVATNLLVCIQTDATDSEPEITSVTPLSQETSTPSPPTTAIEPLSARVFPLRLVRILSPDIFSQSDPLTYLLNKLTAKLYNAEKDIMKYQYDLLRTDSKYFNNNLQSHLAAYKFPPPYVRYAKLLSFLLSCLAKLHSVSFYIRKIQRKFPNEADYPRPPTGISTPELRSLFSTDIFTDPAIPSVLLNRILKISEDRMPKVMANLSKVTKDYVGVEHEYKEYMHFLTIFLEQRDEICRLRSQNAEVQQRLRKHNQISGAN